MCSGSHSCNSEAAVTLHAVYGVHAYVQARWSDVLEFLQELSVRASTIGKAGLSSYWRHMCEEVR
jgi:hypothetical protein